MHGTLARLGAGLRLSRSRCQSTQSGSCAPCQIVCLPAEETVSPNVSRLGWPSAVHVSYADSTWSQIMTGPPYGRAAVCALARPRAIGANQPELFWTIIG
jgi:hypothetical protein